MSKPTVFVFSNGNVAVTDNNGEQIPQAQVSVVELICRQLLSVGLKPEEFVFRLPGGDARPFKTTEGNWNW